MRTKQWRIGMDYDEYVKRRYGISDPKQVQVWRRGSSPEDGPRKELPGRFIIPRRQQSLSRFKALTHDVCKAEYETEVDVKNALPSWLEALREINQDEEVDQIITQTIDGLEGSPPLPSQPNLRLAEMDAALGGLERSVQGLYLLDDGDITDWRPVYASISQLLMLCARPGDYPAILPGIELRETDIEWVRRIYEQARGKWTGLDKPEIFGNEFGIRISIVPSAFDSSNRRHMAALRAEVKQGLKDQYGEYVIRFSKTDIDNTTSEIANQIEQRAEFGDYNKMAAENAEAAAAEAMELLTRGTNWDNIVERAESAYFSELEIYGVAPTWGPFRQAVEQLANRYWRTIDQANRVEYLNNSVTNLQILADREEEQVGWRR